MDFVPFLAMVAVNKKIVDFVKELLPASVHNKTVQAISAVVAVLVAWLFAESNFGDGIAVWDGITLAKLNVAGLIAYGVATSAGAGVVNDVIERRNPDAAKDPAVLGSDS